MKMEPTSGIHQLPDLSSLCRAINEHAPLAMATVEGLSHIVCYVNPAFCRLMDRPAEQLTGKPFAEIMSENDECLLLLDRVYRTGKAASHTEQHLKPRPVFWSYAMWPVLIGEHPVGVMIQVTETAQVHGQTVVMDEAMIPGSVRQHELTEVPERMNAQLQMEMAERNRAEEALRKYEWRLRFATESARLTFVEIDLTRGQARTPENFAAVMGYEPPPEQEADASVGTRALLEHVVPQDRQRVDSAHQEFVGGQPFGKLDYRVLGDDQIERWIETRWSVEFGPDGKPLKAFATNLNITDRKRAEEALHESNERFRRALDAAELGAWNIEPVTNLMGSDQRFRAIFGMPFDEVTYEQAFDIIHPDDRDRVRDAAAAATRPDDPVPFECEYRVVHPDGSIRWVLGKGRANFAVLGAGQRLLSFDGTIADITNRKRADQALRESEERYRNLFNSMDEGYCIIEMIFDEHEKPVDWRYLEVNPSFAKHNGMHEVTGKRILELVPDIEAHWFDIYGKVALTGEPIRFVSQSVALAGRWFDLYAFRVGGPDSRKIAVLFINITARRQAEAQQEQLDRILLDKNIDLEHATAVAEKANRAKSDFLSSMSHELRTPLGAILGFAQLLESATPPPSASQKRSVDQILQAGWYLLELINEILDLALVESGKLSLMMETVSLVEVMQDCQAMTASQGQARGIRVTFPTLDISYFVHADRMRMKQVLINLLSNAIKYNKVNGRVDVTCSIIAPGRLRICVEDTGEGVSPENLSQLFQPFNRLGHAVSATEGTGIGLMMTKRLIELMGGSIGVESVEGKGSVFRIELNLADEPQAATPDAQSASVVRMQAEPAASIHTLLCIEDNPANLALVVDIIARRSDISLLTANDATRGLAIARTLLPDVILMDINLPGISGFTALSILANDLATAHIPVIAFSANAMPHDIAIGLEAGFFRYVTKPIKIQDFMETLDAALQFVKAPSTHANND